MKEGYEGLLHKKGQGRKPKLSEEEWEIVKYSSNDDTAIMVVYIFFFYSSY